jgi:hypothetical protein
MRGSPGTNQNPVRSNKKTARSARPTEGSPHHLSGVTAKISEALLQAYTSRFGARSALYVMYNIGCIYRVDVNHCFTYLTPPTAEKPCSERELCSDKIATEMAIHAHLVMDMLRKSCQSISPNESKKGS